MQTWIKCDVDMRKKRHDDQVDAMAHAVDIYLHGDWYTWVEFLRVQWTFASAPINIFVWSR